MGIAFVLLFWSLVAAVLACLGGLAMYVAARIFVPRHAAGRRRLLWAAGLLPAVCIGWFGGVLLVGGIINVAFLGRDPGVGDGFETPLPDGYAIACIDTTDAGLVYNPRTQLDRLNPQAGRDGVDAVRLLQESGPYLLGEADSQYVQHFSQGGASVDRFFVLDTRSGERLELPSAGALGAWAKEHGVTLHLEPLGSVYVRYRRTWFDGFALLVAAVPPFCAVVWLLVAVGRCRRVARGECSPGPRIA